MCPRLVLVSSFDAWRWETCGFVKTFLCCKGERWLAVSRSGLWDLVAKKSGLDSGLTPSVKLVYVKYLVLLETWLEGSVDNKQPKSESSYNNHLMELGAELKGFLEDSVDDVLILESNDKEKFSSLKRMGNHRMKLNLDTISERGTRVWPLDKKELMNLVEVDRIENLAKKKKSDWKGKTRFMAGMPSLPSSRFYRVRELGSTFKQLELEPNVVKLLLIESDLVGILKGKYESEQK
ncbi:hypothetical protein CCACVL1_30316 [Corchorus capsularis]|uniref:Uncharacterized protein n=1 Tax=Corchorus capsularis TaxID=210143 RepID=A0A1R3FXZ7_COCAP|nr:hypothetical protein CCACVL1_30316 [Corchorus capsularis]